MSESVLPNEKEIEEAVLGSLLRNEQCFHEVQDILTEDCFYQSKHKAIYRAIAELENKGEDASLLNVPMLVKKDGIEVYDVVELTQKSIVTKVRQYAEILQDLSQRRQLWYIAQDLLNKAVGEDPVSTIMERLQTKLSQVQGNMASTTIDISDGMRIVHNLVTDNSNGTTTEQGTFTGFQYIDQKGGLHPSDLVIIAGESSHGKTSFATSITLNAVQNGSRIAFYSMGNDSATNDGKNDSNKKRCIFQSHIIQSAIP
ncbi:MAG: DnaB-like helicase N-terminal domain-containing protein [Bacteroidales bacterium]|nr:DnaB-like helicase N-terminal domain-containing protein [Bacteroidales bacterium]